MAYDRNNIFAKILRGEAPAQRVWEDAQTIAILDVMPQSDGHTLVLPKSPAENLFDLDDDGMAAVMRTSRLIARGLKVAFEPDGVLLMQFNGAAAGQTVFHFHMHVVPRYADKALRTHGRGFADAGLLADQATRLRAALERMPAS
jgi:histidine triad (HIT) family protein